MRRGLVLALVLSLSTLGWATATLVQSNWGNSSGTNCTISISAVGSGHLLVAWDAMFNGTTGTSNSASDGTNTYTHCSNCHAADSTAGVGGDFWYVLASASTTGATTVTLTRSGSIGGFCYFAEYSFTGSSMALDASGSADDSTAAASQSGVALTLAGTNDVIAQGVVTGSAATTINSLSANVSYTNPFIHPGTNRSAVGGAINVTDGSAPTWGLSSSARAVVGAIAFKESGASSPPVGRKKAQVF